MEIENNDYFRGYNKVLSEWWLICTYNWDASIWDANQAFNMK
jgi:hypothetical protein